VAPPRVMDRCDYLDKVGREEAAAVLAEGLSALLGGTVEIRSIEWKADSAASTHPIERIDLLLNTGQTLKVFLKRLVAVAALKELDLLPKGGRKEVLIYRQILRDHRFCAPALYASVYDEVHDRYWLFLEDVGSRPLKKADEETWFAAVRLLARIHGSYHGQEAALRELDCLIDHGEEYYQTFVRVARQNLEVTAPSRLERYDALARALAELATFLAAQPRTLVHGDVFPNNLMVQQGRRIRPIDWESAGMGLGALDLARLLHGWPNQWKARFLTGYVEELSRYTGSRCDPKCFGLVLAACEPLVTLCSLAWDAAACRDTVFVDKSLDLLERRAGHLEAEWKVG
jgi:Phosphotransferase enzyme family